VLVPLLVVPNNIGSPPDQAILGSPRNQFLLLNPKQYIVTVLNPCILRVVFPPPAHCKPSIRFNCYFKPLSPTACSVFKIIFTGTLSIPPPHVGYAALPSSHLQVVQLTGSCLSLFIPVLQGRPPTSFPYTYSIAV